MTEFCLKILNSLHQVSVSLLNVVETVIFQPSSLSLSVNLILLYYQILFVPALSVGMCEKGSKKVYLHDT